MAGPTPMRAIRRKCLDCCCGNAAEVRACCIPSCPLFPYRLGHRPKAAGKETVPTSTDTRSAGLATHSGKGPKAAEGITLTDDDTSESAGLATE